MKKLKVFVLIICCFLLISYLLPESPNEYITNILGINIPRGVEVNLNDTHGGFHGDGSAFAKIRFKNKIAENISTEIKENNNWNELPLSKNLQLIMYGGIKDNIEYSYNLAKEFGIPEIEDGYWMFIDRYDNQNRLNDDTKLFKRSSFNFTIAIYDTDNDVLYYYEFDT